MGNSSGLIVWHMWESHFQKNEFGRREMEIGARRVHPPRGSGPLQLGKTSLRKWQSPAGGLPSTRVPSATSA